MTIEIITRVAHPELYLQMQATARAMANGPLRFSAMLNDGLPKMAETYNILAGNSSADILVFAHDDISFLSKGWDDKIRDAMALGFNVVGCVGTQKYAGGLIFDSGNPYSVGKIVGQYEGKRRVKMMTHHAEVEPCQAVDGCFMAVKSNHFANVGGFDMDFDGLYYYDVDLCLRSKCAVADILIAHEKPEELRGVYPSNMRPISCYSAAFNKKHGFSDDPEIGDQHCDSMLYDDYLASLK